MNNVVDTEQHSINLGKRFKIDFTKVTTLQDTIAILKALDLHISWYWDEIPEQFKELHEKGMLIEIKN